MAPKNDGTVKKGMNKGAWTSEEDQKLSECVQLHGAKRWKTIAIKAVTRETKGSPHGTLLVPEDNIDLNDLFDFTMGGSYSLDWVNKFLELDEGG
ncbi:hypothetical protein SAY86_012373 [Trapa natans]|uniref:Uncharacterized protein n=1 Tax=Trapa natans TaxID=22666 RepID=A0AAN7LXV8_TRANT|nr:hypothetical protein SAY86_012373 [Trapa natans]